LYNALAPTRFHTSLLRLIYPDFMAELGQFQARPPARSGRESGSIVAPLPLRSNALPDNLG
jgi:hypothetical protein